jgi:putative ABC transport system permease protein
VSSEERRRAPRIGSSDPDREARDELESHVSLQAADLVGAGWPEEAARAEASRRLGDRRRLEREMARIDTRAEVRMRRARLLGDVGQDVRIALRQLRQRPGFTVVAVVVLALGIGASAAVFGLFDGALLRPLPFGEAEELSFVWDEQGGEGGYPASLPEFEDWERGAADAATLMSFATNAYTWRGEGEPEQRFGGVIRGDPARTLGLQPLVGRWFTAEEVDAAAPVALLSEGFWTDRFARSRDVVGSTVLLDGRPYTVIGVLPAAMDVLRAANPPSFWLPMERLDFMTRGLHFLRVVARPLPGVAPAVLDARLDALAASLREGGETLHGIGLSPLREELVGDTRPVLLILLGAVMAVLLIVCANVANLVLSRALERGREFAVRVSLGAGRRRLVRQVVTESIVLGAIGAVLGTAVAHGVGGTVRAVSTTAATLAPSTFDARVLGFTAAVALLVAMLFGSWPALQAARTDISGALKAAGDVRTAGDRSGWRRRRLLVAFEIALCLMLLAGAGLLVRSMQNLLGETLGFEPERVVTFSVQTPPARYDDAAQGRFFDTLLERLRALPGVAHAAAASHLPLDRGDTNGSFEIVGRTFPEGESPYAKKRIVTPEYFAALGIPVVRGRAFAEADRVGAPEVVIVSEAVARRYWPGEDPIGRRMRFSWGPGDEQEIVGVVGDVKHDGLELPAEGMVFRPLAQFAFPGVSIVIRSDGAALDVVAAARRVVAELDPAMPISDVRTMDQVVRGSVAGRRTTMLLLGGFALLALVLAAVGVYAVTAQAVAHRTREIGVRMAIGARATDVLRMVLRQEMAAVALGVLGGLAGAAAATRVLAASLYGVGATDPVTFLAVAGLLAAVALLAALLPARRATRVDPVRALRSD